MVESGIQREEASPTGFLPSWTAPGSTAYNEVLSVERRDLMRPIRILLCLLLLLAFAAVGCGGGGTVTPAPGGNDDSDLNPEDTVPDVTVQVVDHRFRTGDLSDDNLDPDPIFALIASASASLDVALPLISRQEVVTALLSEAASGTRVRIVTEKAFYEDPAFKPFYDQLEDIARNQGNLSIRTDNDGLPREMHARFLIIDQARVVTGSYNWESESADRTFGDVITILNTNVAAAFTGQFNQMFVEGNFGVHKRNAGQHSFLVGGGNGLLEVYFGPTDQPQDLIETEISQSQTVFFAIQQFKDIRLANFLLNHLQASTANEVVAMFNDNIFNGDSEEQAVYTAFANYTRLGTDDVVGTLLLSAPMGLEGASGRSADQWPGSNPPPSFADYNTMNHKLMFVDHALSNNQPAVIFGTANYSNLGFAQNDEIFLILRGSGLTSKYIRGMSLNSTPPSTVQDAEDVQEFNQLLAMWPFDASPQVTGGMEFRDFMQTNTAIIFGEISNFNPVIKLLDDDGEELSIPIDATFAIRGTTFFGQQAFGGDPRKVFDPNTTKDPSEAVRLIFPDVADPFVGNDLVNPDHRFLLVVPAGDITISTIVTEGDDPSTRFTISERKVFVGPGAVREINLQIGQLVDSGSGGGGAGA
jgi:cardiolipin hydrolase